jgi:hypothetical protein
MHYFYWLLCRINEVDLDSNVELTPPSLMGLKWELFNSYTGNIYNKYLLTTGFSKDGWSMNSTFFTKYEMSSS